MALGDILAGKATVLIGSDDRGLRKGLKGLKGDIEENNALLNQGARGVRAFSTALLGVGTAATIGFGIAIRKGIEFEDEMQKVRVITGATREDFEALGETALQLGRDTTFTATEVAQGMVLLSRAGFDANETIAAIPQTLALARVGALELAQAADIIGGVSKAFGFTADESQRVADVIGVISTTSATDVEGLGESMKFVAGQAALVGISIEDTATALGLMGDRLLRGGIAGRNLNRAILKLADPKVKKQLEEQFNIRTLDVLTGEMRSIVDIAQELGTETAKLGKDLQADTFRQFFDVQGARAMLAIASATTDQIDRMQTALTGATGKIQEMQKGIEDTLGGELKLLVSAITDVAIAIKDDLDPELRDVTGLFTDVAKGVGDLLKDNEGLATSLAALTGAVTGLSLAFVGLSTAVIGYTGIIALTKAAGTTFGFVAKGAAVLVGKIALIGSTLLLLVDATQKVFTGRSLIVDFFDSFDAGREIIDDLTRFKFSIQGLLNPDAAREGKKALDDLAKARKELAKFDDPASMEFYRIAITRSHQAQQRLNTLVNKERMLREKISDLANSDDPYAKLSPEYQAANKELELLIPKLEQVRKIAAETKNVVNTSFQNLVPEERLDVVNERAAKFGQQIDSILDRIGNSTFENVKDAYALLDRFSKEGPFSKQAVANIKAGLTDAGARLKFFETSELFEQQKAVEQAEQDRIAIAENNKKLATEYDKVQGQLQDLRNRLASDVSIGFGKTIEGEVRKATDTLNNQFLKLDPESQMREINEAIESAVSTGATINIGEDDGVIDASRLIDSLTQTITGQEVTQAWKDGAVKLFGLTFKEFRDIQRNQKRDLLSDRRDLTDKIKRLNDQLDLLDDPQAIKSTQSELNQLQTELDRANLALRDLSSVDVVGPGGRRTAGSDLIAEPDTIIRGSFNALEVGGNLALDLQRKELKEAKNSNTTLSKIEKNTRNKTAVMGP